MREHTLGWVRQHCADFGPELARESLASEHSFIHRAETLRGWMIAAGMWKPKLRQAKRVHPPRPRRDCLGELMQIDGSHHDWFEARGARSCLTAFIDDATGRVLAGRFDPTETTEGYLATLCSHITQHGVPLALYSDRHSIFTKCRSTNKLGVDTSWGSAPAATGVGALGNGSAGTARRSVFPDDHRASRPESAAAVAPR